MRSALNSSVAHRRGALVPRLAAAALAGGRPSPAARRSASLQRGTTSTRTLSRPRATRRHRSSPQWQPTQLQSMHSAPFGRHLCSPVPRRSKFNASLRWLLQLVLRTRQHANSTSNFEREVYDATREVRARQCPRSAASSQRRQMNGRRRDRRPLSSFARQIGGSNEDYMLGCARSAMMLHGHAMLSTLVVAATASSRTCWSSSRRC